MMNTFRTLSPVISIALVVVYSLIGMATGGAGLATASPLLIIAIALPILLDRAADRSDA